MSILCYWTLIPGDLFTRWGIYLFSPPGSSYRYFRSGAINLFWPPDSFRGIESYLTPASEWRNSSIESIEVESTQIITQKIQLSNLKSLPPLSQFTKEQSCLMNVSINRIFCNCFVLWVHKAKYLFLYNEYISINHLISFPSSRFVQSLLATDNLTAVRKQMNYWKTFLLSFDLWTLPLASPLSNDLLMHLKCNQFYLNSSEFSKYYLIYFHITFNRFRTRKYLLIVTINTNPPSSEYHW